jgi:hypothetical protein
MIQRFLELERRMAHLERRLGQIDSKATQAAQNAAQVWGNPGSGGPGGGGAASYWCMCPTGGWAASTGTFETITPTGGSVTVFISSGGTLNTLGTRTVRWWYRDACPQYSLVPLAACDDGSFDAIANSCTIVNP